MAGRAVFAADPVTGSTDAMPSTATFDLASYNGKKLLLFFYSLDDPRCREAVQLMNELYTIRQEYNFDIAGISINPDRAGEVQRYNQHSGIAFPVYCDYNRLLYARFKMTGSIGFYLFNRQGKWLATKLGSYTPQEASLTDNWRAFASGYLKFGYIPADEPVLGIKPPLPPFKGKTLSGSILDIKELYPVKPCVVVIFSPKCSHCEDELTFLNSLYTAGDLKEKFEIAAISTLERQVTADFITSHKFTFPVIVDEEKKILHLFPSYTGSIPLSYVVDRKGSVISLHRGFDDYARNLYVMELKKLAGLLNTPLLSKNGYSGEKTCVICHEKEAVQWKLTKHVDAFLSLVRKGEEDNESCVSCHVTGLGSPGGYTLADKKYSRRLEGVQCESCHGAGYASCSAFTRSKPVKIKTAEWQKTCTSCHTEKETLNFVFASRFPRVLHANVPDFSKMSRQERMKFVRAYREKKDLFDNPARYMGAESCRNCHEKEYRHWQTTVHAGVYKTRKAETAPSEKLFRYNTGAGSAGGYPEPGLEGVQCEACHGPGEKHIANPEAKCQGYIVALSDECSSCVVEQICRRCHSSSDDPKFDFQKELEQVRHK